MSTDERRHNFTWKIENFSSCTQKNDSYLDSPTFTAESLNGTEWFLSLYPRGLKNSADHMACFLNRAIDDTDIFEVECMFNIEVIDADDEVLVSTDTYISKFKQDKNWGTANLILNDGLLLYKSSYFTNDTLTIRCRMRVLFKKSVSVSENAAFTNIEIDRSSFNWIVSNLSNIYRGDTIVCPALATPQFELSLLIPEDDIKIRINEMNVFIASVSMICKITLLDVNGKEQDSKQATHMFHPGDVSTYTWEFPNFLRRSKLNSEKHKYLNNDSFTLHCEITFSKGTTSNILVEKVCDSSFDKVSAFETLTALQNDLKSLHHSKFQTDVELHAEEKVFLAHKCILSSRSPVFLAMFDQNMVENQTGLVFIRDLDSKTVELLLEFMYTGTVTELNDENAINLLLAADKYQVFLLKEICSDFLTSTISNRTVCDVLICADLTRDDRLITSALSFLKKRSQKFFVSDEWKIFVEKNPKLSTDIVLKVLSI